MSLTTSARYRECVIPLGDLGRPRSPVVPVGRQVLVRDPGRRDVIPQRLVDAVKVGLENAFDVAPRQRLENVAGFGVDDGDFVLASTIVVFAVDPWIAAPTFPASVTSALVSTVPSLVFSVAVYALLVVPSVRMSAEWVAG